MDTTKPRHIGRNISRIRELRGMKQEALAQALGISQQTVSTLENSEEIDDKRLKEIAEALGVHVEGLRNFSEESVINYVNNFYDNSSNAGTIASNSHHCTFNPLDKLMELVDENKRLYERLVEAEKSRADALEKLLGK
jgi:transcriptional regulator with XRE-family HTH domain